MVDNLKLNWDDLSPQQRHELAPYAEINYTYDPDEERFCKLVASTSDVTRAMMEAYPSRCDTEKKARRRGTILANTERMAARIDFYRKVISNQLDISTSRLMAEMAAIATSDPISVYDRETGEPLPPHKLPRHVRAAVKKVKQVDISGRTSYEYEFHNKMEALKLLSTIKGLDLEARKASAPKVSFNLNLPSTGVTIDGEDLI